VTDLKEASSGSLFGKMNMDHEQDPPATKLEIGINPRGPMVRLHLARRSALQLTAQT